MCRAQAKYRWLHQDASTTHARPFKSRSRAAMMAAKVFQRGRDPL
jgi:hypothetical protein